MKKQTTTLDAIRTFYIAEELLKDIIRSSKKNEKRLRKKLEQAVRAVNRMNLRKVLTYHLDYWGPRYDNYFNSRWVLKRVSLSDCGVWPHMGGLPNVATKGTVVDTAEYLRPYLEKRKKMTSRVRQALYIEKLGHFAEIITEYIPIIVLEGGVIRHNKLQSAALRKIYKRTKYDIDDGNHRAVALALQGRKDVLALVGVREYKNRLIYF